MDRKLNLSNILIKPMRLNIIALDVANKRNFLDLKFQFNG